MNEHSHLKEDIRRTENYVQTKLNPVLEEFNQNENEIISGFGFGIKRKCLNIFPE